MVSAIAQWLAAHGLERYAEAFERDDVGVDVLGDLSEAELDRIGVSLGDRKRLARALAGGAERAASASPPPEKDAWARQPGERKPVTMLFADVTGSTALTESLDAEDAHELLYAAVERMCAAVERNRGTVCRFMGDGVMAMFGAPVSFDDHPQWACRAALEMLDAVDAYACEVRSRAGARLRVRIGLHAGEVVVLRVGDGVRAAFDASGPTVPLAARMEQTAAPGTVQMTAATYALVADRFSGEALPPVAAKGFSEPVPTVRLLAERHDAAPADARPFVGRRSELAQLRAVLDGCEQGGSGRMLYLRGEPGIGKSRLVEALAGDARERGVAVHRTLVLDFGTGKGRDPIRLLVRDLLGLAPDASEEARRDAASRAVADGFVAADREAHLCDLLDVAPAASLRAAYEGLDAATRARERCVVLGELLGALAKLTPRLVVVEDVHWAPVPIRAYLRAVAERLPDCPAILAVTSRSENDPLAAGWHAELEGLPMTLLALGPLTIAEAQELAARSGVEDPELVAACVERSGRNPLFLEHLLGAARDGAATELPTSIQTSVAARVDGLEPADKRAVQGAAVLGKRFEIDALRALLEDGTYECTGLVARGLVKPDGDAFLFAHALVQESVLASLLRAERRRLHARAADWYRAQDPVLYASHLDFADDARAPGAYLDAARAEVRANRFVFARGFVERALELDPEPALRATLHALHGRLLMGIGEMRAASDAYRRAAECAEEPGARCAAWTGSAHALRNVGAYAEGLDALEHAERDAAAHGLVREQAGIHHHRGNIFFLQVDADACEREQRLALELARRSDDPETEALALSGLARTSFLRGHTSSGGEYARQCVDLARRHDLDAIYYGHLHMVGIGLHAALRLVEALEPSRQAAENAARVGVPRQAAISHYFTSQLLSDMERRDEARRFATRSLELSRSVGEPRYVPAVGAVLAMLAARDGHAADAERDLVALREGLSATDMSYAGPLVLGALVHVAGDDELREQAIADGRALRHGLCAGNFLHYFYRDAIHASLARREWQRALELAAELDAMTRDEPLPLTDFYIAWARAAAPADGDAAALAALRARAAQGGLAVVLPTIDAQLG